MTLEEYKNQIKKINDASKNFSGTQEEFSEFLEKLAQQYPYVTKFNSQAVVCNDLNEFKKLADSFGMKFSSTESMEKLFSLLMATKRIGKEKNTRNWK